MADGQRRIAQSRNQELQPSARPSQSLPSGWSTFSTNINGTIASTDFNTSVIGAAAFRVLAILAFSAAPLQSQEAATIVTQESTVQHETTCADLFAAPPFDDLLTRNGGRDIAQLRSRFLGSALIGVLCSKESILDYVGPADWKLDREMYGLVKAPKYKRDEFYEFCIPRRWFGLIPDPCQSWAQFYLFEGRITEIKVSGGL